MFARVATRPGTCRQPTTCARRLLSGARRGSSEKGKGKRSVFQKRKSPAEADALRRRARQRAASQRTDERFSDISAPAAPSRGGLFGFRDGGNPFDPSGRSLGPGASLFAEGAFADLSGGGSAHGGRRRGDERFGGAPDAPPSSTHEFNEAIREALARGPSGGGGWQGQGWGARGGRFAADGGGAPGHVRALELWNEMRAQRVPANARTYSSMLKACAAAQSRPFGESDGGAREKLRHELFFAMMRKDGLEPDASTYEDLLQCCAAARQAEDAALYFAEARARGLVLGARSHLAVLRACAGEGDFDRADAHLRRMRDDAGGGAPDAARANFEFPEREAALERSPFSLGGASLGSPPSGLDADVGSHPGGNSSMGGELVNVSGVPAEAMFSPLIEAAVQCNRPERAVAYLEQLMACDRLNDLARASRDAVSVLGSCILHNRVDGAARAYDVCARLLVASRAAAEARRAQQKRAADRRARGASSNQRPGTAAAALDPEHVPLRLLDRGTHLALTNLAARHGDARLMERVFAEMEAQGYPMEQAHHDAAVETAAARFGAGPAAASAEDGDGADGADGGGEDGDGARSVAALCEAAARCEAAGFRVSERASRAAADALLRQRFAARAIDDAFYALQDIVARGHAPDAGSAAAGPGSAAAAGPGSAASNDGVRAAADSSVRPFVPASVASVVLAACGRIGDMDLALDTFHDWASMCSEAPSPAAFEALLEAPLHSDDGEAASEFVRTVVALADESGVDPSRDARVGSALATAWLAVDEVGEAAQTLEAMRGAATRPTARCAEGLVMRVCADAQLVARDPAAGARAAALAVSLADEGVCYLREGAKERLAQVLEYAEHVLTGDRA
jgi:hypothetical protein